MVTTRRLPMLAGGLLAVAALTGCATGTPVQTSAVYDQADGSNILFEVGGFEQGVSVRNALVLTQEEGAPGQFYGTVANLTDESHTVELAATGEDGALAFRTEVTVPPTASAQAGDPEASVQIGTTEHADQSIPITSVPGAPGENITITVSVDGQTQEHFLPVLGDTFERYDELMPEATA